MDSQIKGKFPNILGWQLDGWSFSHRDGQGCGGIGWRTLILAEATMVSLGTSERLPTATWGTGRCPPYVSSAYW